MNRRERRAAAKKPGNSLPGPPAPLSGTVAAPQVADRFAMALSHHQAGRLAEAESLYRHVCALDPGHFAALHYLGVLAGQMGQNDLAIDLIGRALALKPDYVEARFNLGNLLAREKRLDQAAAQFARTVALRPDLPEAHHSLGLALQGQGLSAQAIECFARAIALKPDYVDAYSNQGAALAKEARLDEAAARFRQALALTPGVADLHNSLGAVLLKQGLFDEAMACFERALGIKPDFADALYNKGFLLAKLNRVSQAIANYEKALASNPDHPYTFSTLAHAALDICDWSRTTAAAGELESRVRQRKGLVDPSTLVSYGSRSELQLECAKRFLEDQLPARTQPLWSKENWQHERVRIAYLSADFRQHAVAVAMAEIFELHDRTRFEVLGISLGPDDRSAMRSRLIRAFDQFHDVQLMSDREVAKLLNDRQIDIAVDLNGYTEGARSGILAHRPAPVQAIYLGYAGTTGADFIDYVIADPIVLPFEQQPFYSERIVHLPDCYLAHDSTQTIAGRTPSRSEAGLPDRGFVFCCFNNSYKITRPMFEVWMRLLDAAEGSVLWLSEMKIEAMANLRGQAGAHGIDPARLIFAPKLQRLEDHLARYRLADLFLDTLPYNAHSTASDALRVGLPVLTCTGTSFAGRVATSLLCAAGLAELATGNLAEYENLALRLSRDASLLLGFKERLARSRSTSPLFDTRRLCRHLESAYSTMWEIQRRGEKPRSFSVETLSAPN
jgi:protein O-GlcNAc transferase